MLLFSPFLSIKSVLSSKTSSLFSVATGKAVHRTDAGKWSFQLFGDNIIKTTFQPIGYTTNEQVSNAVIGKPTHGKKLGVHNSGMAVDFTTAAGVILKEEKYSYQFGGEEKDVQASYFSEHGYRGFRFLLQSDEQIFGGGERALPMNRRGHGFSLYNSPAFGYGENTGNLNFSIPFVISSAGYGIFFDNASAGYFDIGNKDADMLEAGFTSGELTFYIINGANVHEILKHYTGLVGRQPIPARWVFGNLMSRFGYRSEEQLLQTVAKMKEENFPIDAVILDLFWFGDSIKNTMGNLDWVNTTKWPDPEKMISGLKDQGIKTVIITEPYVVMGSKSYTESKPFHAVDVNGDAYTLTNFYFGFGGLLDLFRTDAQDWFWTKYKKQIDKGVAGWWGDLGEPETHPADVHHNLSDLGHDRLFEAHEVHNLYGHNWNKFVFEKYRQDYPDVRVFNLNRSGFAGSQRYGIFPWSGDVGRNWSGFRAQLPVMLGMSISGVPYVHADAGGFAMGEKDGELYTRWLQFAAFTPIFRPHGTALEDLDPSSASIESEPVFYPEPYKSIVRRYIQLRYDLLPYNYTLAYEQSTEGKPLTRPMFYNDSSDSDLLEAGDQYMWGDRLLVAPVLHPGATERRLYLPDGYWYNYFTREKIEGGQWITDKVDINDIPLYVKAGSFIPTRCNLLNTESYGTDVLQVTYYPSAANSAYTLFDDDGKTNLSVENGKYELLQFNAAVDRKKYVLKMSSVKGSFDTRPAQRAIRLSVPGLRTAPLTIKMNGHTITVTMNNDGIEDATPHAVWDAVQGILNVCFCFTGELQSIEIAK